MKKYGIVIKEANLRNYNTYRLDVSCKYLIIIETISNLKSLIEFLNKNNEKYFVIGNGSNIILPSYYDGVIIKLNFNELVINDNLIEVGSSYMINKLAVDTVNLGLSGLEWASGIPGTVGGSIINNANCYDGNLMTIIRKLEVLDNNEIKTITTNDFEYGYRYTSLKKDKVIILKAYIELKDGNKDDLLKIINDRTKKRIDSQPLEYPSAGSVFRNPENLSAWKLIDDAGLKGYQVGGAQISLKHANFIINKNNATSEDIKAIIDKIKITISEKDNIDLILEQEIIN